MCSTRPVLSRDNNSTSFARVSYSEMDSSEYTIIVVFLVYIFHSKILSYVEVALFWKATNSTGLQLGGEERRLVLVLGERKWGVIAQAAMVADKGGIIVFHHCEICYCTW